MLAVLALLWGYAYIVRTTPLVLGGRELRYVRGAVKRALAGGWRTLYECSGRAGGHGAGREAHACCRLSCSRQGQGSCDAQQLRRRLRVPAHEAPAPHRSHAVTKPLLPPPLDPPLNQPSATCCSDREKFMALSGGSLVVIFFLTSVGATLFYALGLSMLLIGAHAAFRVPGAGGPHCWLRGRRAEGSGGNG